MKNTFIMLAALASILNPLAASAMTPAKGRIVVFADKKEGLFKSDLSIKIGTLSDLKNLRMVDSQKGVHACFVGKPEAIRPLLESMIANSNKSEPQEGLTIKSFEPLKDSTIHVEVMSRESKETFNLNIGPC